MARASRFRITHPDQIRRIGERQARRAGPGEGFYDQRPYVPGDELRLLNWRAYARTGRLYVRQPILTGEARFTLWIDGSESMRLFGKLEFAERVAEVLRRAAVGDRLRVLSPQGLKRPGRSLPLDPRGPLGIASRGEGTHILITDALEDGDWEALLRKLAPVHLVVVLAPEELHPTFGEAILHDVEHRTRLEVDAGTVLRYREALKAHLARLKRAATRRGNFALLPVGSPIVPGLLRQRVIEPR